MVKSRSKKKNPTSNSMKSVSGGSGSSAKTPKKKSKGKEKAQEEDENTQTVEKAEAVEAPPDGFVDAPVEKPSCMRENSSGSKSTKEATPEVSVEEARAESTSDEIECEILAAPPCKADDPPTTGSTAQVLFKSFESRREQAHLSSHRAVNNKAPKAKQSPFKRLEKFPDFFPPGLNSEHLHFLNELVLFWHKAQNVVFIDEQEKVMKTILFIMLVIKDICRPIVIVSSVISLPLWESKFQHLAPNIKVVSYTGTKPLRKLMRDFEFYEESGGVFQVLLSHPDAILEDFDTLDSIGWEAVIVDECQNSHISKYLEKFKNLSCDFRLFLLTSPVRMVVDIFETSKVMEHWVPARFSGPSQQEISNQAAALASVEVGANLRGMQKDLHPLQPQLLSLCQSASFQGKKRKTANANEIFTVDVSLTEKSETTSDSGTSTGKYMKVEIPMQQISTPRIRHAVRKISQSRKLLTGLKDCHSKISTEKRSNTR